MDRTNLLKALPFLFPLEPMSWPPPVPVDSMERSNCRRETLLSNFSLSIEPVLYFSDDGERLSQQSNCSVASRGPAFFLRTKEEKPKEPPETHTDNDTFDPAMCPIELSMQSVTLNNSTSMFPSSEISSLPNRFASPTAYHKLMRLHQQTGESHQRTKKQIRELTMVVKIDGLVYQVDLAQIENVQLVENTDNRIPTCLFIQFGSSCIFRIFNMTQPTSDSPSLLSGVQTLLVQLFTADDQIPAEFPNYYYINPLASPTGSSTTAFSSSQEPGQRDFSSPLPRNPQHQETPPPSNKSTDHPANHSQNNKIPREEHNDGAKGQTSNGEGRRPSMHSHEPPPATTTDRKVPFSPHQGTSDTTTTAATASFRKRQAAFVQFQSDLDVLDESLMVRTTRPNETGNSNNNNKRHRRGLQSQVAHVMASIPEQLAQSYCTQTQLQERIQQETERIHSYEVELEMLVQSFWPTLARKSGASSSSSDWNRQPSGDHPTHNHVPQHECIARATALLQKRKEATAEKLALALLPTRGT